ncbi:hypothetical protein [Pectobacterium atrosepticum]|uniref:hypothetical protein n=1 Tax=Pectobacterium atrosepticum TaxID=29471 RepID=UPI00049A0097|nr:hypothetical protein [Pectobacterium atrosepticum]AIA70233.1 hypothetical protein EV46_06425 [Pectobacterium atrosepticum]AIK13153.1 hypothetical protein GZ59_13040 [Pectobacterium atrosepticum]KFX16979.1 hypothetical protein JV34_03700 [Pectobacterium atrosepticum]KMK80795.1 hypothetical protein KCQ_14880 [Pectobacterium atrosepticum ICMP 1526]POW31036.1 hypothetical protein PB72LOC_01300 [Pectobacterium atrosepticum]
MTGDRDEIYRLVGELLHGIQHGDTDALVDFGVNPAIYEEILEELDSVGETIAELTLPPYDMAFTPDRTGRIPLCSYVMDASPQRKRVECQLWSGEKKTELTLIADYPEKPGKASLVFRLLETQ